MSEKTGFCASTSPLYQSDPNHPTRVLISVPLRYTFTVDASMNHALKKVGIGIVIQETPLQGRRGPVIEQLAETFPASGIPASEIELFAILRAVEIAVSRGLQWVKIRSDCNQGRRKIKADVKNQHQGNSCTARGKILDLAKSIENLQIAYCPRRKNQMAHRLARMGAGIAPKSARKRETGLVGNVDSDDQ